MRVRKRLRFCAVLAAALLVLPLAACGGKNQQAVVTLSQTSAVLYVGESLLLTARGGAVTYASTDESCAEVTREGLVTARAVGAAVIIARGGGGVAVCEVVVSGEAPVKLEAVTITRRPPGDRVENRDSLSLSCELEPENANDYKAVVWSSSHPEVASVNQSGKVEALSAGSATITVTAVGTEVSDYFVLTVAPRSAAVTLNYRDVLGKIGEQLQLDAQIEGDFIPQQAEWDSTDSAVVEVAEGLLTFRSEGQAEVSYSALFGGERVAAVCRVAVRELAGYTVVRTPRELQDIGNVSGNYALGNDVDFAEAVAEGGELYNGSAGFAPLFSSISTPFSGLFDGFGYTISNLVINRPSAAVTAFIAFMSSAPGSEGRIQNLALVGGSVTGINAAPFFGNCSGRGSADSGLKNCYSDMEVRASLRAAGLCLALNGTLKHCYSASTLYSGGGNLYGAAAMQVTPGAPVSVIASFALDGEGMAFAALSDGDVDAVSGLKSMEQLKEAATYAGWDTKVWSVADGALPRLVTPNGRVNAGTRRETI